MSGQSKRDEFFIVVVIGLRKCTPYFLWTALQKPVTKKQQMAMSHHVDSDSTWHDDCQILIGSFPAAAD
jgi:hypothetical protein